MIKWIPKVGDVISYQVNPNGDPRWSYDMQTKSTLPVDTIYYWEYGIVEEVSGKNFRTLAQGKQRYRTDLELSTKYYNEWNWPMPQHAAWRCDRPGWIRECSPSLSKVVYPNNNKPDEDDIYLLDIE